MFGISVVILTSLEGRGLGLFLDGSRMPRMGLLLLVRFPFGSGPSWVWLGVSVCLLDCVLLRRRMYLPTSFRLAFRAAIVTVGLVHVKMPLANTPHGFSSQVTSKPWWLGRLAWEYFYCSRAGR